jgi:hypothetical protein
LANEVFTAAEASGEKLWRMPLEESYWESMKSGVADMVNTGARQGGAITAALFLKHVRDHDNPLPILVVVCPIFIFVLYNALTHVTWTCKAVSSWVCNHV